MIPSIRKIKRYSDGVEIIAGIKSYNLFLDTVEVLNVIDLLNKAQEPKNNTAECKVRG